MGAAWPSRGSLVALLLLGLVLVEGEALAKHQRSDEAQQVSSAQIGSQSQQQQQQQSSPGALASQQASSGSASQQQSGGQHQPQAGQSAAPSLGSGAVNGQAAVSASQVGAGAGGAQAGRADQMSGYQALSGYANSKAYMDSMAAMSGNPEQSYQAAANSVNLALANSGIYNSQGSPMGAQQGQAASSADSATGGQALKPLHYFYYPSKEAQVASGIQAKSNGADLMSNAASNNYQSISYPSYADQLSGALAAMNSNSPDAAASAQDPTYLAQPQAGPDGSGYASAGQQAHSQATNQQQSGHQSYGTGDLSSYASQPSASQLQSGASISFSGPSSDGRVGGPASDFLSAMNQAHQQQPSAQHQSGYQGDLSTSNFGSNNLGGSPASYMPPASGGPGNQHDLFGQQFSSAASQLSSSSVSPPLGAPNAPGQQVASPQQQVGQQLNPNSQLYSQAPSSAGAMFAASGAQSQPGASPFAGQTYLNSFLTPQQYSQLTGQQMPGADQQLVGSSLMASQSMAAGQTGSPLNPMSSASQSSGVQASSNGGKRFGISSFIMPMLALAGLSLLIPTMSNIGTAVGKRKKRSVEDRASAANRQQQINFDSANGHSQAAKEMSISEYMDKIERYYSIYKNAVESDDCLNRLICEFGDAVKDITGKSAVVM